MIHFRASNMRLSCNLFDLSVWCVMSTVWQALHDRRMFDAWVVLVCRQTRKIPSLCKNANFQSTNRVGTPLHRSHFYSRIIPVWRDFSVLWHIFKEKNGLSCYSPIPPGDVMMCPAHLMEIRLLDPHHIRNPPVRPPLGNSYLLGSSPFEKWKFSLLKPLEKSAC